MFLADNVVYCATVEGIFLGNQAIFTDPFGPCND